MTEHLAAQGRTTVLCLFTTMLISCSHAHAANDSRRVFSADSPAWLRAVGKLQVPGQRMEDGHSLHYLEDCSATLVALPTRTRADTIVTAWHCLELYADLSRPIVFTLSSTSGDTLRREAYRVADGGGMHADWAILRLYQAIAASEVDALALHPQMADTQRPVTMAGYSGDSGLGGDGEQLTYDPACTIHHQQSDMGDTDCTAHKGASGGAVIQTSGAGDAFLCGVISQGNGEGRSTFVPVNRFRAALIPYLR